MVYELRKWFDNGDCLYTDDRRVKDLAMSSPDLRIVGRYFRSASDHQPFAWDIVGDNRKLAGIAHQFDALKGRRKIV